MMNIANMGQRLVRASLILAFGAALAGCNGAADTAPAKPPLEGARIGGAFTLTDQNGKTVRDSDFAGKYRLVYFGYSFCPDICPVDLQKLMRGLAAFEKSDPARGAKVAPIFITVDPERDTPAVLADYLSNFDPRIVGLTGSLSEVQKAAAGFRAMFEKLPQDGDYTMNHTAGVFLHHADGRFASIIDFHEDRRFAIPKIRRILT